MDTKIHNILSNINLEKAIIEHGCALPKKNIPRERILHMHGVAELMYQYYDKFHCNYLSKEEIYILGLNHDIGYLNGKTGHESYGATLFARLCEFGLQNTFAQCILHHGDTPQEYMKSHMCSAEDIPNELILLWWADMCVESSGKKAGEIVGFQKRLDSMKTNYGEASTPYQICKKTIDWLITYMSQFSLTN